MRTLHEIVVLGGKGVVLVCLAATVASLVLRGRGKASVSNRALVAGFLYCAAVTVASLIL